MKLTTEQKLELAKLLIECAKERQKECGHLSIGNYVRENLDAIVRYIDFGMLI